MEYVDLGLPSGKKWAKCNLGANSEEEYGLYFAWGGTVGYSKEKVGIDKYFAWCDYKFNIDPNDYNLFRKYNETDRNIILDLEDDAAYNMLGENWKIPTIGDFAELIENTTTEVISINLVNGVKFTSKHNGNYIFLPFAGCAELGMMKCVDSYFFYWASNLTYENSDSGFLFFGTLNGHCTLYGGYRMNGRTIRAIYEDSSIKKKDYNSEYVDLGLPSGKKWAKCNLGATSEEEAGLYYQWGDTVGYTKEQIGLDKVFNWTNYKFSIDGSYRIFSKYDSNDRKTVLDLEDDAVYAALGGNWKMPTHEDWQELDEHTSKEWTQINGVNGYKLTASNGNYIFLPAAGLGDGSFLFNEGSNGRVWSSSLYSVGSSGAFRCIFGSGGFYPDDYYYRYLGFSVRGIYIDNEIKNKDMEYVDLGLPSGKKWAKCNLGATSEEQAGLYYQWGDTVGYTKEQVGVDKQFVWSDYKFGSPEKKFTKYNSLDNKTNLDLEDDAAYVALGGNWRIPTQEDVNELVENTTSSAISINGIRGMKFTSNINGNYIFFPFTGFAQNGVLNSNEASYIWNSECLEVFATASYAFDLYENKTRNGTSKYSRFFGHSIRPILLGEENEKQEDDEIIVLDKVVKEEATYPYYDLLEAMNDLTKKIPFMKNNEHIASLKEYAMSTINELDSKERQREQVVKKLVEAKSWFHVFQYSEDAKVGELYMFPYNYISSNNILFALVLNVRSFNNFGATYNAGIDDAYIDIYAKPKNSTNEYGSIFAYKLTFEKASEKEVIEKVNSEIREVIDYRMKKIKSKES